MTTQNSEFNSATLLKTLKRLTAILATEVQMIKDMKLSELHTVQEEKLQLLEILEKFKEIINQTPDILKSIDLNTKNELKKANNKFEGLVQEDGKQLTKAKKVQEN
jgi:hypothetical protein